MTTQTLRNLINGEYVDSAHGRTSSLVNPATEQEFAQAAVSGREDVDRAMNAAADAFEVWRDSTPAERQLALLKLADAMERRADEFVAIESENTGKPLGFTPDGGAATGDRPGALLRREQHRVLEGRSAGSTWQVTGHTRVEHRSASWSPSPRGTPCRMAASKVAAALAAGAGLVIAIGLHDAASTLLLAGTGSPSHFGVFNVVTGDRDTGALVEHPIPQLVSITGSVRAGAGRWPPTRPRT